MYLNPVHFQDDDVGGFLEGIEAEPRGAIARICVLQLRLVDGSPLQSPKFDGAYVFVEWCFLDFSRDLCETIGSFKLPRTAEDVCVFNAERGMCQHIFCDRIFWSFLFIFA